MEIDPHNLPADAAVLQQMVRGLLEQLDAKQRWLSRLQHLLEKLLRWRYGPRRERVDENQLFLFAAHIIGANRDETVTGPEDGNAAPPSAEQAGAPPTGNDPAAGPEAKGQGHGRQRLPQSLARRRVVHDLAEDRRLCPECQGEMKRIGEEISERLEYVPASLVVIQDVCQKYACAKGCTVVTADKPAAPIEKGLAGPGLLAHVAVSKYGDHLPLHRQEGILQRQGVELSRQTMADWMRQCAELLSPLYERMKQLVLASKVAQTDDTPVPVLDLELIHTRTGRIWAYLGDRDHPYIVYDYTPDRSSEGPKQFLQSFRGFLQADAYSGYDGIYKEPGRGVTEVGCWAHARRYFFEAQTSDLMRSMVMLAYIGLLYGVEDEAREKGWRGDPRLALRQAKSVPVLGDIHGYLEAQQPNVLPKSPMGQAICYTLGNWEALLRYSTDGDLEIDNNACERALRLEALGRKNWMFFGSDNGGRTNAVLSSSIASCKRHHIDPFAYLRDVLQRISTHPRHRLDELLPDKWAAEHPPPSN